MSVYSHQTRLILVVGGVILSIAVLLLLIVFPLLSRTAAIQGGIKQGEEKLLVIAREIENYKVLSSHLAEVSRQKAAFNEMFPEREDMVSLVEALEQDALSAGLSVSLTIADEKEKLAVNPKERPRPPILTGLVQLEEVPYILSLAGDYRGLTDFLLYLEHLSFVTAIDKISIAAEQLQSPGQSQLTNTGTATARLEGMLYILNKPDK